MSNEIDSTQDAQYASIISQLWSAIAYDRPSDRTVDEWGHAAFKMLGVLLAGLILAIGAALTVHYADPTVPVWLETAGENVYDGYTSALNVLAGGVAVIAVKMVAKTLREEHPELYDRVTR